MSGAAASGPGASRQSGTVRQGLGRWLLAPDFYREREVRADNWVEAVFEPAALVLLIALFIAGVVSFGLAVAPDWDARFVLPLSLVVSAEAFLYSRRLARSSILLKEWAILLLPPLLLLRFLPYLAGSGNLRTDVAYWWAEPASFFTASYIVNALLLLLAWQMSLSSTQDLNRLRVQPGELLSDDDSARRYEMYDASWRFVDHGTPLRHLALRVLWGGVVLVLAATLTAVSVRQLLSPEALIQLVTFSRPSTALAFSNVIVYFVVGLLFLAEAQYVRQRTAWQLEGLAPPGNLASRWIAEAAVATAAIVALALLLPTDYAMTVSDLLAVIVGFAVQVMQLVVGVALLIMMIVMSPLRWLFPGGGEESTPAMRPLLQPEAPPPAAPVPWLDVLKSLIFWLIALAIVGYCLSVVWRKRPPLPAWLDAGLLGRLLRALGRALLSIKRWSVAAAASVAAALPRIRPAVVQPVRRTFQWLALSRLGPRQLVEYFYLSVLERAARLGYARQKAETASEFSQRLPEHLPDVEPDLSELTWTFLQVRYSPRPAEEGLVRAARARWQTLKLKLRGRHLGRLRERETARRG